MYYPTAGQRGCAVKGVWVLCNTTRVQCPLRCQCWQATFNHSWNVKFGLRQEGGRGGGCPIAPPRPSGNGRENQGVIVVSPPHRSESSVQVCEPGPIPRSRTEESHTWNTRMGQEASYTYLAIRTYDPCPSVHLTQRHTGRL